MSSNSINQLNIDELNSILDNVTSRSKTFGGQIWSYTPQNQNNNSLYEKLGNHPFKLNDVIQRACDFVNTPETSNNLLKIQSLHGKIKKLTFNSLPKMNIIQKILTFFKQKIGNWLEKREEKLSYIENGIASITHDLEVKSDNNKLITDLEKKHPLLEEHYNKAAGVSEGYTIREHTLRVLNTAKKFESTYKSSVENLVPWSDFLLFLTLHDIGKGIAFEAQSKTTSTHLTFKEQELEETKRLMQEVMKAEGVPDERIDLFVNLLSYDTQGLYLRDFISDDEATDNIIEMAFYSKTSPQEFYALFEAYHAYDAASYPALKNSIFAEDKGLLIHVEKNRKKIDFLKKRISDAQVGANYFERLFEDISIKKAPLEILCDLCKHMDELTLFVMKTEREMLLCDHTVSENRHYYAEIKNKWKKILLYCLENTDKQKFHQNYKKMLLKGLGRTNSFIRDFEALGVIYQNQFNDLAISKKIKWHDLKKMDLLFERLANFRRSFLIRYSLQKVQNEMMLELKKLQANSTESHSESEIFLELKKKIAQGIEISTTSTALFVLNFLHGTNSNILPNLLLTDMQLIPTGRLLKMKIVPFSGELDEGSTAVGVNQFNLSGTGIDGGERAVDYAKNVVFHTTTDKQIKIIETFLKRLDQLKQRHDEAKIRSEGLTENYTDFLSASTPIITALRRLRVAGNLPEDLKLTLLSTLDLIKTGMQIAKTQKWYKQQMPKALDPTGKLGYKHHDNHYLIYFQKAEGFISQLEKALNEEIRLPFNIKELSEKPFPIVFGSSTLQTKTLDYAAPSAERCSPRAARLGKEISHLFVDPENKDRVESFVAANNLQGRIQILSLTELESTIELHLLAVPYFSDILGLMHN